MNNSSKFNFDIILKSLILSFLLILNDNSLSELRFIGLSSIKSKLVLINFAKFFKFILVLFDLKFPEILKKLLNIL